METKFEPSDSAEVLARVRDGLALVDSIANQIHRRIAKAVEVDELVSAGREGLVRAARDFDSSRGVPFRAWATLRIRGAVIDGLRAHGALPRTAYRRIRAIESANSVQLSLEEGHAATRLAISAADADARLTAHLTSIATAMAVTFLEGSTQGTPDAVDDGLSPEESAASHELRAALRAGIRALPDAERRLVERHYYEDVTLDEAAREQGLSKSWGSRLHARAMDRLAKQLINVGIEG